MDEQYLFRVTDDDRARIKQENPNDNMFQQDFVLDDGREFQAIFRKPTVDSFRRYLDMSNDSKRKNASETASLAYVKDSILCPTFDEFFKFVQDLPALTIHVANALTEGMGIVKDSKKKNL